MKKNQVFDACSHQFVWRKDGHGVWLTKLDSGARSATRSPDSLDKRDITITQVQGNHRGARWGSARQNASRHKHLRISLTGI
jgi:hypothetical protein